MATATLDPKTTTKTQELLERQKKALFPAVSKMMYYGDEPLAVSHAKNQYLWDVEGNKYLDFFGGILTVSVGHANDEVTNATIEQLKKVQHTSALYMNEIVIKTAEKIAKITPGRLQSCFFTNSGSEANETAIMAARMYTGNTDIVALRHAYSGRTSTTMSVTAHGTWRMGGVFDGYIKHVRNPYTYRRPTGMSEEQFLDFCVAEVEEVLATVTSGKVAAFMAEPIQGVGGFIVAPKEYFKRIQPIIKAAGGVMIIDEVQTGWGRTGKYWCGVEHWDIEPEIMVFAKSIANGGAVGCTITTPEVAEAVQGLTLSTFGGNPVAMATTLASIEYMEKNKVWENAEIQGGKLRSFLESEQKKYPWIGDVRGMGLMQGMELISTDGKKTPDKNRANAFLNAARKRKLLIGKGGLYGNVIRISPHLNVSSDDMTAGCQLLGEALADVA